MTDFLLIALRICGGGLIVLALLHIPIGRQLGWRGDAAKMRPENAAIFHVHTFFVCLTVTMMGLPSLIEPEVFIEPSRAGLWFSTMIAFFWLARLYCQFFVYRSELWRGKRRETGLHYFTSVVWLVLVLTYGWAAARQWSS